ncbi:MAG: PadR family transcriptional regulator [Patescibacteria group bacterium]
MTRPLAPAASETLILLELCRGIGDALELRKRLAARMTPSPPPTKNTFYNGLNRLLKSGLVESTQEKAPLRRGREGHPRTFFSITSAGKTEAQRISDALRKTLLPPQVQL